MNNLLRMYIINLIEKYLCVCVLKLNYGHTWVTKFEKKSHRGAQLYFSNNACYFHNNNIFFKIKRSFNKLINFRKEIKIFLKIFG